MAFGSIAQDFDAIYLLDLGGNVRKNPKLSGTTHNVFGIQVGVSVNFLVKKRTNAVMSPVIPTSLQGGIPTDVVNGIPRSEDSARNDTRARIFYARVDEFWRKGEKYSFLEQAGDWQGIDWQPITPNKQYAWLTEGLQADFETFPPIGTKEAKAGEGDAIFATYGRGVATSRDAWAYNYDNSEVVKNMQALVEIYNDHVSKWKRLSPKPKINDFVRNDAAKISWSRDLKLDLERGKFAEFVETKIRNSLYRPFSKQFLFFDRIMNEEVYQFPGFLPINESENENRIICISDRASEKPFACINTFAKNGVNRAIA